MFSGMLKTLRFAAFAAAALTLAACGGGGGGGGSAPPALSEAEIEEVRSDPEVMRIGDILARADALLLTGFHTRYSLEGGGQTLEDQVAVDEFECTGPRCVAQQDGTEITVGDLTGPAAELDVRLSEADLASRGTFHTADTSGSFEIIEDSVQGVRVTATPTVDTYGFWGAYGYAALELGAGPLTGNVEGTSFSGDFAFARAYAAGAASGANPAGTGSAEWTGIVEASPTASFERLTGSVTLTIADLAQPRVGVAISIDAPGHATGKPAWADVPLTNGGFSSGTARTDYIEGNFHGPGHEEAWGVFDTDAYLGAFGAKRAP